jgi:hypothetical protein
MTYTRGELLSIGYSYSAKLDKDVIHTLRCLGICVTKTTRGCRGSGVSHKVIGTDQHKLGHPSTNLCDKSSSLLFGLLNARSVNNKQTSICETINENNLDLLAITETWLDRDDNVTIGNLCPPGYHGLNIARDKRGGGLLLSLKTQ